MIGTHKSFIAAMKKAGAGKELLKAMEKLDRADFFDPVFKERFYVDMDIPIGAGEICESPGTLQKMISRALPLKGARVLEVGTGSGYSSAVLSLLAGEVITIDINETLASAARIRHERLRIRNTRFFVGDGTDPSEELGKFDAIFVFSACYARPLSLAPMLKPHGKLIFPMGPFHQQQISVFTMDDGGSHTSFHEFCSLQPVRGRFGTEILNYKEAEDMADSHTEEADLE